MRRISEANRTRAVMDARVNLFNQEVFRLAREADKDGSRTSNHQKRRSSARRRKGGSQHCAKHR
jgi:hypothetical protein